MIAAALIKLIGVYQIVFSRLLFSQCRFHPSCSQYTREAIAGHGPARGVWLGLKRISRCHPWHEGGFDPVPDADAGARCRCAGAKQEPQ
ncbi:MAG: membrane protein insertion efficiency factor YidD [Gammaproteobacteria bacterium]|nr:membrane protein insertion efficiency factor YidD [Gammaproteobacteria bacterium]MCY4183132.1 membrane protein insertion efficiency factor YidD [Gammaproteobacteria bacterium]MCY4296392.1 membrane protein insertion efficiency factor YidD [Gammaproteobacteria bacterium]